MVEKTRRGGVRFTKSVLQTVLRKLVPDYAPAGKYIQQGGGKRMSGNGVFIIDCIVTGVIIFAIYLYNKKHDGK